MVYDLMNEKSIYCHWLILEVETNTPGVSQDHNLILQNLHIKTSLNWLLNANYDISINNKNFNLSWEVRIFSKIWISFQHGNNQLKEDSGCPNFYKPNLLSVLVWYVTFFSLPTYRWPQVMTLFWLDTWLVICLLTLSSMPSIYVLLCKYHSGLDTC